MTREHKLALIVGFSLILLVGVLISDHLSSARQAQVGTFGPGDTQIAEVMPAPIDPLRAFEPSEPRGWNDSPALAEAVPQLPSPIQDRANQGIRLAREDADSFVGPVMIGQGPEMSRRYAEEETGLQAAIEQRGGVIEHRNGIPEIVLPAAVQMRSEATPASATPKPREQAAAPATAEVEYEWHTVQRGESLFKICERLYGDGNLWRELVKHNSDRVDENGGVRAGVRIRLPSRAVVTGRPGAEATPLATRRATAAPAAPRTVTPAAPAPTKAKAELPTYTVRTGDTLGTISQRTLGTARRWREIAELNRIDDENLVRVGRVLKIPANANQG